MSQRLFTVSKIGCFLDTYSPGVEKRRGEEISVVTLTLRVQPFDAKLASALDQGVGGDSNIKATVFSLNTAEPKPNFTRHDFTLGLPRQNLTPFASPDTNESRLLLGQARISGTYVRTQKDMNALAFVLKATLGPVGRDELEFIHAWHRTQKFVTFEEAEHALEFEEDPDDSDDEATDADEKAQRPARMFDDPRDAAAAEPAKPKAKKRDHKNVNRKLHTRGRKRTERK
jgi:hypothetical protein